MFPHNIILIFHNLVRWMIVITGLIVLGMAYRGWLGKRPWTGGLIESRPFLSPR